MVYRELPLTPAGVEGVEMKVLVPADVMADAADVPSPFRQSVAAGVIMPGQTHSVKIGVMDPKAETEFYATAGERFAEEDGLITSTPGISIGVRTADCVPVLLYAPDIRSVAAVHAGWRGTLDGIVSNALDMLRDMGAAPARTYAVFGPSISGAVYEVSDELGVRFEAAGFGGCVTRSGERPHIDLQGVNRERMLRHGLDESRIITHGGCTLTSLDESGRPLFCSYRRNATPLRQITAIRLL
ncbi:MAG: polyphenol oxidase family protein [Muribaculaceae bacterium]|nr:polyphenol oxidase family protein [Muribaculaceae bacterium]